MPPVRKDARLTFRVSSALKQQLEGIAKELDESVARVCEAFLTSGVDSYERKGKTSLERYLGKITTGRYRKD